MRNEMEDKDQDSPTETERYSLGTRMRISSGGGKQEDKLLSNTA